MILYEKSLICRKSEHNPTLNTKPIWMGSIPSQISFRKVFHMEYIPSGILFTPAANLPKLHNRTDPNTFPAVLASMTLECAPNG